MNTAKLPLFEPRHSLRPEPRADAPLRAPLTAAGLFAGIGGIELGLAKAGHETSLLCEIDDGAAEVLRTRFPEVPLERDVCALGDISGDVTLVSAGFPCQDLSQAGRTAGIAGSRSGLVGEVFRLLESRRVPWLLIENVSFMLQLARGEALEVIVRALEALGYKWAYRVVDSRSFGVPQRRQRVYLVAALDDDPRSIVLADDAGQPDEPPRSTWRQMACGFYWTEGIRGLGWAMDAVPTLKGGSTVGIPSSPAIVLPDGQIVKPEIRDAERLQGFDADWTEPAESVGRRGFRWKLVGNAVTVGAAEWIGMRLRKPRDYDASFDVPLRRTASWPKAAWNLGDRPETRMVANVSQWPLRLTAKPLEDFLQYDPTPLSLKATRGFYSRATSEQCNLRFPQGFLDVVRAHAEQMANRESVRFAHRARS